MSSAEAAHELRIEYVAGGSALSLRALALQHRVPYAHALELAHRERWDAQRDRSRDRRRRLAARDLRAARREAERAALELLHASRDPLASVEQLRNTAHRARAATGALWMAAESLLDLP